MPWYRKVLLVFLLAAAPAGCGGGGGNGNDAAGLELNSGGIQPGLSYAHTFLTEGTFTYHCAISEHNMIGQVVVQGGPGRPTQPVDILSGSQRAGPNAYFPSPVTIDLGDTVIWTNRDALVHTVTSP